MELTFTPLRVAALVALILGFALLGGFVIPEGLHSRAMRAWVLTILLFLTGAVSATVIDHWIGTLDRSNLRWFYIVIGICAMAGALTMRHVLASA